MAAGATGIQRVVTGVHFSMGATVILATSATIGVRILDGSTMIWASVLGVGTHGISPYNVTGLNLLTSAATELSAAFSNGVASATQFVTLTYHDLGI